MLQYSREVPYSVPDFDSALTATVDHVRAHLSACGDERDSEDALYSRVAVTYLGLEDPARVRVTGALDVELPAYELDDSPVEPVAGEGYVVDRGEGELR